MTEPNVEPTPTGGAVQQPTGAASPAGGQPSAITDELKTVLEQIVDRKLQSQKDKRVAGLMGKLDNFENSLARMEQLTQDGWNKKQALKIMQLEEATEGKAPTELTDVQRPGSQAAQPASYDPKSVIESMGLDPSSPDVVEVIRKNPDALGQILAFASLAQAKRQAPAPSPAQQQPSAAGTGAQPETIETLSERLVELNKLPGTNMKEIQEINRKLAKLRGR